jgi:hypothetical protein
MVASELSFRCELFTRSCNSPGCPSLGQVSLSLSLPSTYEPRPTNAACRMDQNQKTRSGATARHTLHQASVNSAVSRANDLLPPLLLVPGGDSRFTIHDTTMEGRLDAATNLFCYLCKSDTRFPYSCRRSPCRLRLSSEFDCQGCATVSSQKSNGRNGCLVRRC